MGRTKKSDTISIVIPTKNRVDNVFECVRSIQRQTILPDELVIVDASDSKELEQLLETYCSEHDFAIIYTHSNSGTAKGRNIGAQISSGDIILFVDDDVILDTNYIKEIMAIFGNTSFERVGCVYGAQIPVNTRNEKENNNASNGSKILQAIYKAIYTSTCWLFFLQKPSKHGRFRLSGLATYPSSDVATIIETESASSAYLACYKDVFNEFRFDENLERYAWGEDDDFTYRLSRKYKIIFTPEAKVTHKVSRASRISTYEYNRVRIENHFYIFRKNFPQALRNRFAFGMSVLGLFLISLEYAIIHLDWQGVRGFFDGLRAVQKKARISSA